MKYLSIWILSLFKIRERSDLNGEFFNLGDVPIARSYLSITRITDYGKPS